MDKKTERLLYLAIVIAIVAFSYFYLYLPGLRRKAEISLLESEAEILSSNAQIQNASAKEANRQNEVAKARQSAATWFKTVYNPELVRWLRQRLWTKKPGTNHYWIHDEYYMKDYLPKVLAERGVATFKSRNPEKLPIGWKLETNGNRPGREVLIIPTAGGNIAVDNPQVNYPKIEYGITP